MGDQQYAALSIGQLARLAGVSPPAIRYYERIGLLPRPERSANGYRHYHQADVNRIRLLQSIRRIGTPLAAAKPLVDHAPAARCAEVRQDLLVLVNERLVAIDHEIAALHTLRAEVHRFQRALQATCIGEEMLFAACSDALCVTQPDQCVTKEIPMLPLYEQATCDCECPDCPNCPTCCGDKGCCGLTG